MRRCCWPSLIPIPLRIAAAVVAAARTYVYSQCLVNWRAPSRRNQAASRVGLPNPHYDSVATKESQSIGLRRSCASSLTCPDATKVFCRVCRMSLSIKGDMSLESLFSPNVTIARMTPASRSPLHLPSPSHRAAATQSSPCTSEREGSTAISPAWLPPYR